ncbi:Fur-regulated basic protein FbpA [Neobacillus sp. LXY-4]|uniref:Fur-regulated basic protein FbpA n=1 Tax=Neobacillus sp. LXY-4 TaxID=3379826 RepID=UPI003EE26C81
MPLLREAVENLRVVFINRLIQVGAYKKSDQTLNQLTLTELIKEYKMEKKRLNNNTR